MQLTMIRTDRSLHNIASELQKLKNLDNKASLYDKVTLIRASLTLSVDDNINFFNIIQDTKIAIIEKFAFQDIYGYLDKTPGKKAVIIINEKLKNPNFVLAHELMHLLLTSNEEPFKCNLKENFLISGYAYEEWRANEGAAELLVPFSSFLPDYDFFSKKFSLPQCIDCLANKYYVPKNVIKYRIENLKKEYLQYADGVDVSNIRIGQ